MSHEHHEDHRHSDPEHGGLSSGEKAWLSRGRVPHTVEGNPEKMEAAEEWMHEHPPKEAAEEHHDTEEAKEKFKDLTPAERAVLSRGQHPKSIDGNAKKERLAKEYVEYKKEEKKKHHK